MKVKTPFKMIVPGTIHQELTVKVQQNAPEFTYELDDFALILNYLFHKENVQKAKIEKNKKKPVARQDKTLTEWYPINPNHLKEILCCKTNRSKYIKFLVESGILETDNDSRPGLKSRYYRLNPFYKRDIGFHLIKPETRQFEKMNTRCKNKKAHYNRFLPHLTKMKDKIMNMDFNVEKAQEYISQCTDITRQYFLTHQLESLVDDRQRFFSRKCNKGRLYTNLTNLKKDFRQFIEGVFSQIDVKNSHPFLLNQLIWFLLRNLREENTSNKEIKTIKKRKETLPLICDKFFNFDLIQIFGIKALRKVLKIHQSLNKDDLVNLNAFSEAVNTGMLYDNMVNIFSKQGKTYTRDDMKELILTVIYSKNEIEMKYGKFEPYKKEKRLFYEAYPVVAKIVELLKSKNDKSNATLSVLLQNVESSIIVNTAARELVEADIVPYTIHDAIVVEREHQQKAIDTISAVYNRFFGTVPRLKIEDFGSGNSRIVNQQKIA